MKSLKLFSWHPPTLNPKGENMEKQEKTETKALTPHERVIGSVMNRIAALQNAGQIQFPGDYSPQNALQSAWLILQETTDMNKKPVLDVCTKASVANSLLDMVISGLNPAKKQGYFIAYGTKLCFQRSYFGSMAMAKRVDPDIADIVAEVIFEDDEFEYEIVRGRRQIAVHKQTLESVDSGKVKGAYCMVIKQNGEITKTELMTFDEIKAAWAKSKMKPVMDNGEIKKGSTHGEYLTEMCRKTIINRTCKPIINSSSDKVLLESVHRAEFTEVEEASALQIAEKANQEFIDIEPEPEPDTTEPEATTRRDGVTGEQVITGNPDPGNTPGNTPGPPAPDDLE